jgi:competence/damage-inducible protein CinA-like protein
MDRLDRPALATAEIIAVGTEMLGATRLDTNSLFLAGRLGDVGIVLRAKSVVADDRERLRAVFLSAMSRADLIILTGGLGPTDDDLTREVVAAALDRPLSEDPTIVDRLRKRFERRGLRMPDVNRRQAMVPAGAVVLDNPNGTAPGLLIEHGDRVVVLLPGPPRELKPMFDAFCDERLSARTAGWRIYRRSISVAGRGESHVEEIAQPIYSRWTREEPPIETTILAVPGQVELHLTLRDLRSDAAESRIDAAHRGLVTALGHDVFSIDGRSMEEIVGGLLRDRGLTISAAESCTGGLLLSRLTEVPGSSAYVLGGAVTYSNDLKSLFADVPAAMIAQHGAVSEPVAVALAEGIRSRTGAAFGVGITGIAGPDGGTAEKPVGTVAVALAGEHMPARVRTLSLFGGRQLIRFQSTQAALDMVRRQLLGM